MINLDTRHNYIKEVSDRFFSALGIKSPSADYKTAIAKIVETVTFQTESHKVNAIPLETGAGKTTLIKEILPVLYKYDPTSAGTIILTPYAEERYDNNCTQIANDINRLAECDIALPLDSANFKTNQKIMRRFPILIMTHQRYRQRFHQFKDFLCWTDGTKHEATGELNTYYRRRLLIDEALSIVDVIELDSSAIAELTKLFQGLRNYADSRAFEKISNSLNQILELPLDASTKGLKYIKPQYNIPDRLKQVIDDHGTLKQKKIFTGINNLPVTGGYISYSRQEQYRKIYACAYANIFDGLYNVHIFDGTARINEVYTYEMFDVLDIPQIRIYDNVSVHVDNQVKASRNFLSQNPEVINKTVEYIYDHLAEKKVLLITHTAFKNDVKELLTEYQLDNVAVEHWGGTSGTNKYQTYDTLVFLGVNHLSDVHYVFLYHLHHFDFNFNGKVTASTHSKHDRVKRFRDTDYETVRQSALAVDIAQAINRIQCRRYYNDKTPETHIFIGYNDMEVLNRLESAMPGISIVDDYDIGVEIHTSTDKPPDKYEVVYSRLWNHTEHFPFMQKISKTELFDGVCSSRVTKSKILRHPSIIALQDTGFIKIGHRDIQFVS